MKYALVDGIRQEARPGLQGQCPCCDQAMIAKCGEYKAWHWAHKGRRRCDPWWENETEWHRDWKNKFPETWQEQVKFSESGEKHIADVETDDGWVLEFQHSHIKPEERRSRESFYGKLAWVVNGLRRKKDLQGFERALKEGTRLKNNLPAWMVWSQEGVLMRQWFSSCAHVFFVFGADHPLWWLSPDGDDTWSYAVAVERASFIATHQRTVTQGIQDFDSFVQELNGLISRYKAHREAQRQRDRQQALAQMTWRPRRRRLPRL